MYYIYMIRSLTGDRPTGKLHIGHYIGSLKTRMDFQGKGYEQYVMIADVQALTDHAHEPDVVRKNVLELALDYLAVGLDPKKTTFFIQSQIPEISELALYFLNLVTISRLAQNPTVKTEMKEKGFEKSVPAGFYMYPVSQAADILSFRPDVVPVGEDQLPMIEQTNEIVEKFNSLYGKTFKKVKVVLSDAPRVPGIDGRSKMGKSLGNAIFLSDSPAELEEKVRKMYTDPTHIHAQDPGQVEGNVVFSYLDAFDAHPKEIADLKKQYAKGGLGDTVVKKRLHEALSEFLDPIRERREKLSLYPEKIMHMLEKGTAHARREVQYTLHEAKKAMGIEYFKK